MVLHDYTVNVPRSAKITICPIGDFHLGTKTCAIEKLQDLIDWIKKTPNVYVLGMGDYCDCINLSDPRFDPSEIAEHYKDQQGYLCRLAQTQAEECIELLKPIRHKIIGLGIGNHELAVQKRYHYDMMYRICGALDVRYLGWSSMTRFRIKRAAKYRSGSRVVTIFAEHGLQAGRKKGGKINSLEDRSNDMEADIYLRGHSHDKVATTKVQLHLPKEGRLRLEVKKRVYAICPSYFVTYKQDAITYGEIKGYPPTATGVIKIEIDTAADRLNFHIWQ